MKLLKLMFVGLQVIGAGIHIWTLLIIYNIYGFFGAVVSLFMPVISQIYLFIISWKISGTFLTQYNLVIIVYIFSFIVWYILVAFLSKIRMINK